MGVEVDMTEVRMPKQRYGMSASKREGQGAATLHYPWSARRNPAFKRAEQAASRWVQHHGLFRDRAAADRFDEVGIGMLVALAYPDATPELLELCAQMLAWVFIEDDRYDLAPPKDQRPEQIESRFEHYLSVLRTGRVDPSAEPAARALHDLNRRLMKAGSAAWHAHFVDTMRQFWMDGIVVETYYRARGISPDPASYMAMRAQTVGIYICLDLLELAVGCELTPQLRADPILRRVTWLTSRIVAYVNDLFSYHKERSVGDVNNYLHVLRRYESLELGEGIEHVVRVHDRELNQFCQLDEAVRDRAPEARRSLDLYVDGCRSWMSGVLRWQQVSPRYASGRKLLNDEGSSGAPVRRARSA